MSKSIEIISQGRVAHVREWQLEGLRRLGLGWPAYCQARLTRDHFQAIEHMMRHRRSVTTADAVVSLVYPVMRAALDVAMPQGHDYDLRVLDGDEWPLVLAPGLGELGDIVIRFRPRLLENGLGHLDAQAGRVDAVGRWVPLEGWTVDRDEQVRVSFYGTADVGHAVRRVVAHTLARAPFSVLRMAKDEHDPEKIRLCVDGREGSLISLWRATGRAWALSSGAQKASKALALSCAIYEAHRRLMTTFEEKLAWL